jgi:septal ring factor EnvC (AmiA/AmiB activator)
MRNPFLPKKEDVADLPSSNNQPEESTPARPRSATPWWVAASLAALVVAVVFVTVLQHQANADLIGQLEHTNQLLTKVENRTASLESNYAELQTDTATVADKLGVTQKELDKARATARWLRSEQKKAAEQFNAKLDEHATQLDSIDDEVSQVRDQVSETQENLDHTRMELSRAMGDLGEQSGLIARNHGELEELKKRGEREYVEFDIRKSKHYSRVGNLSVRLNKTDTKRSKFTLTVLQNDKRIEKKDRTLYEPVQFYSGQKGQLLELVVFQLDKNRVSGYLSLPKNELASNRPTS